jgi:dTDP-4-dehydrorhamnose 3,5-epimerase-like enzyme
MLKIPQFSDDKGNLCAIEASIDIPFEIKRVYYITDVRSDTVRGNHSHRKLHQVLICLNGTVRLRVYNGTEFDDITLSSPNEGVYIGPHVWREMHDFSDQSVLMVLASQHYDESDYIRSFDQYISESQRFFAQEGLNK